MEVGDVALLDVVDVETPTLCDVETLVLFEALLCADEVGGAEDALEDPLDAILEDAVEVAESDEDGAVVADVLAEDGGGEDAGAEEEEDGGLLELDPPFGTATTTPPCTLPLACVDVPAALDL